LFDVTPRISTVRSSFHRQIQRIEDRKALMTETKTSWQLDQAALVAAESAHDLEADRIKRTRQSTALWCSRVGRDVSALKTVLEALRPSSPSSSSSSPSQAPAEASPEGSLLSTRARLETVQGSLSEALKDQVRALYPLPFLPSVSFFSDFLHRCSSHLSTLILFHRTEAL
jgi:hypothetical protein